MRLSNETLDQLASNIERPQYDRAGQATGIVHFGIGAFHRAHQAWYTDQCLAAGERGWLITGVSMRSANVAEQLNPQDGLYTVTQRSGDARQTRIVGAVREVLIAGPDRAQIVNRLADSACRIASFTVTEKGYCQGVDGALDIALAQGGFYPILTEALSQRKAAGLGGLTLMSCDNVAHNGRQLHKLMQTYLRAEAPNLLGWYKAECTCPSTMVDRIVPASTPQDRAELEPCIGMRDEGAVFTEEFSQWVIEDAFAGSRPAWQTHGVQLVKDVAPYEDAKLRMLNGAHSLLAYAGLRLGYSFVHEAMADAAIAGLVRHLLSEEAAPSIEAASDQDLVSYARLLEARFADPALNHRLEQIAMDGSQKIPQRWLATLTDGDGAARDCPAILTGIAAWIDHIADGSQLNDPAAERLRELWQDHGREGMVDVLFGSGGMFGSYWMANEAARDFITNDIQAR